MAVRLLVEERPGAGKTTVASRIADRLAERGVEVRVFITREVLGATRRIGFEVENSRRASRTMTPSLRHHHTGEMSDSDQLRCPRHDVLDPADHFARSNAPRSGRLPCGRLRPS